MKGLEMQATPSVKTVWGQKPLQGSSTHTVPVCGLRGRRMVRVQSVHSSGTSSAKGQQQEEVQLGTQEANLRSLVSSSFQYSVRRKAPRKPANPVAELVYKIQLAWKIFFPEQPKELSPKETVKKRLKMVLVADRCGMSPASLAEMKKTIVKALQDFVDIEGEDGIEVSITTEPGLGTVYSVNIPVRRVKAEARFPGDLAVDPAAAAENGVMLEWDPSDPQAWDTDPASRFPMGC